MENWLGVPSAPENPSWKSTAVAPEFTRTNVVVQPVPQTILGKTMSLAAAIAPGFSGGLIRRKEASFFAAQREPPSNG
jgi:hypothetical protein